jgi:hypothetical protein
MNTEFDGDDEGSSRGNCVLIAYEPKREQDRTALGSQPPRQNSSYPRGLRSIGQKTGHVLVRTPGVRRPGF